MSNLGYLVSSITGCVSIDPLANHRPRIKRVLIASLLRDQSPIRRIGLLGVGNKQAQVRVGQSLNDAALAGMRKRLAGSPSVTVVALSPEVTGRLLAQVAGVSRTKALDAVKGDLVSAAKAAEADAVILVLPTDSPEPAMPNPGVFWDVRTAPSSDKIAIVAEIDTHLLSAAGESLLTRGAGDVYIREGSAKELGLTADLASVSDASVASRVSAAIARQVQITIERALELSGY